MQNKIMMLFNTGICISTLLTEKWLIVLAMLTLKKQRFTHHINQSELQHYRKHKTGENTRSEKSRACFSVSV